MVGEAHPQFGFGAAVRRWRRDGRGLRRSGAM